MKDTRDTVAKDLQKYFFFFRRSCFFFQTIVKCDEKHKNSRVRVVPRQIPLLAEKWPSVSFFFIIIIWSIKIIVFLRDMSVWFFDWPMNAKGFLILCICDFFHGSMCDTMPMTSSNEHIECLNNCTTVITSINDEIKREREGETKRISALLFNDRCWFWP